VGERGEGISNAATTTAITLMLKPTETAARPALLGFATSSSGEITYTGGVAAGSGAARAVAMLG
jgi:hypothetical protein